MGGLEFRGKPRRLVMVVVVMGTLGGALSRQCFLSLDGAHSLVPCHSCEDLSLGTKHFIIETRVGDRPPACYSMVELSRRLAHKPLIFVILFNTYVPTFHFEGFI